ncbi:hypothetical protein SS50377_25089 [Spironucleus salmonicida]|uniref:Uncharacterized protein n=1 Tax=Spironucleus salmonicida TaxID=348837 RepID=V6LQC6_9EUKA|nr:hypothetical protein SS50377_25089 [Spironucleus salmonicida]|eukprot:EST42959.1 Hypothetical protein SS50377_17408 [Spironucleus salmonicida]
MFKSCCAKPLPSTKQDPVGQQNEIYIEDIVAPFDQIIEVDSIYKSFLVLNNTGNSISSSSSILLRKSTVSSFDISDINISVSEDQTQDNFQLVDQELISSQNSSPLTVRRQFVDCNEVQQIDYDQTQSEVTFPQQITISLVQAERIIKRTQNTRPDKLTIDINNFDYKSIRSLQPVSQRPKTPVRM